MGRCCPDAPRGRSVRAPAAARLAYAWVMAWSERSAYTDTVIYAKSSPYQRIVLTRNGADLRLHLNGN